MAINNLKSITQESPNWKVVVNPRPYDWNVEVWFIERRGGDAFCASFEKGENIYLLQRRIDAKYLE